MINWQNLIAYLLIGLGGTGGIGAAIYAAWKRFKSWRPVSSVAQGGDPAPVARSADEPAPAGAVEWATDICSAMGTAPDSSKLAAILAGSTRDQARGLRIAELEQAEAAP